MKIEIVLRRHRFELALLSAVAGEKLVFALVSPAPGDVEAENAA